MYKVYKSATRNETYRYICDTENEYQAKQVTNALNKMALGHYSYWEVTE